MEDRMEIFLSIKMLFFAVNRDRQMQIVSRICGKSRKFNMAADFRWNTIRIKRYSLSTCGPVVWLCGEGRWTEWINVQMYSWLGSRMDEWETSSQGREFPSTWVMVNYKLVLLSKTCTALLSVSKKYIGFIVSLESWMVPIVKQWTFSWK